MSNTIRFYGLEADLQKWRAIVAGATGKECTPVTLHNENLHRYTFEVDLTTDERQVLQDEHWYAESGTGEDRQRRPYRWNDCVTYEVIRG